MNTEAAKIFGLMGGFVMKRTIYLRRFLATLAALCMTLAMMPEVWAAGSLPASGQMGDNVYWSKNSDNANDPLIISGNGSTWDLDAPDKNKEWTVFLDQDGKERTPTRIQITDGVTAVGRYAFANMNSVYSINIEIADSVTRVGANAFSGVGRLSQIFYTGSKEQWDRIQVEEGNEELLNATIRYWWKSKDMPRKTESSKAVEIISSGRMGDQISWTLDTEGLLSVNGSGAIWDTGREHVHMWDSGFGLNGRQVLTSSIRISDGITIIADTTFGQTDAKDVWIPSSVTYVGWCAFFIADNLTDVYYAGSESQWNQIHFETGNEKLLNANIHFGAVEPDEPSAWAKAEVESATSTGLVPSELQKNYKKPVSRGEVARMFVNLVEQSSGKSIDAFMTEKGVTINPNAFSDTTDKAVLAANALGILSGTGGGRFSPDGTLSRAQIAAIINRVAVVLGIDTAGYTHSFTDVSGHWADKELGWPSSVGVMNGVGGGKFNPDAELTTEQAIAITYRALQALKNGGATSSEAPAVSAATAGTLQLRGVSYTYANDTAGLRDGNPDAVGVMQFSMTVEGPQEVETVLIAGFFEKLLTEQEVNTLLAQHSALLKEENTPLLLKSVPFDGGSIAPVMREQLGKTLYYVFAGYDKNVNPIAYAIIPVLEGSTEQTSPIAPA